MSATCFETATGADVTVESLDEARLGFLADLASAGTMNPNLLNGNVPETVEVAQDVDAQTIELWAASGHCAVTHV